MYVYQAVRRNKENQGNKDREQYWEVAYPDSDHDGVIASMKRRVSHKPGVWRIYRSVNQRDIVKAKLDLLDILTKSLVYEDKRRVETIWRTVLMQPKNKAERLFLLDIDSTTPDIVAIHKAIGGPEKQKDLVFTPNGYHMITEPFNPTAMVPFEYVEIKKDAFLFIEKFEIGA